jgi:hypothetical protein
MAIKLPFKITLKNVLFFISIITNLLGGTGQIQPLLGGPEPAAPAPAAAPSSPHAAPAGPAQN